MLSFVNPLVGGWHAYIHEVERCVFEESYLDVQ